MEDFLLGVDKTTWEDSELQHDLICVNELHQPDLLISWGTRAFLGTFHSWVGC
jgi:hypothetical protein